MNDFHGPCPDGLKEKIVVLENGIGLSEEDTG